MAKGFLVFGHLCNDEQIYISKLFRFELLVKEILKHLFVSFFIYYYILLFIIEFVNLQQKDSKNGLFVSPCVRCLYLKNSQKYTQY